MHLCLTIHQPFGHSVHTYVAVHEFALDPFFPLIKTTQYVFLEALSEA